VRHDLAQLGQVVRARRHALGLTQREASIGAGISDTTWFSVEQGKKVADRTLARVERAMRWPPGTIDSFLTGEESPVPPLQLSERIDAVVVDEPSIEDRIAAIEAELEALKADLLARRRARA